MKRLLLILKYGRPGRHMPPGLKFIVPVRVPPVSLREIMPARPQPKNHLPQVEGLAQMLRAMELCRACGAVPKKNVDAVSMRKSYGILRTHWPMWFAISTAHLALALGVVSASLWQRQATQKDDLLISHANILLKNLNAPTGVVLAENSGQAESQTGKILGEKISVPTYQRLDLGKAKYEISKKVKTLFLEKHPYENTGVSGIEQRKLGWGLPLRGFVRELGYEEIKTGLKETSDEILRAAKNIVAVAGKKAAGQIYALALQIQNSREHKFPFFGGKEFQTPEIVRTISIPQISLKELPKKTLKTSGKVLGESVLSDQENTLSKLVEERLNQYLAEGKFKGEKGEKGEKGDTGPQGAAGSSLQGGGWSLGYVNTNNPGGTGNGTIGSFTYFSSDKTQINVLNVSSQLNVSGPANFTGTVSFATTTLGGIAYAWPSADGSNGQVLTTDGLGQLSWSTASGGGGLLSGGTRGYVATWASSTGVTIGTLLDNGTVSGVNATSSSYTFNIQGSSGISPLSIASSTGTSLLVVTQSGNVGIGTTSPIAKLDVYGNLNVATSSTSVLFANTGTSKVGIGTSTPGDTLHIVTTSAFGGFTLQSTNDVGLTIKSQAGNGAELKFSTQGLHLFARANSSNLFIGNSGGVVEMIGINGSVSSPNSVVIGRQGAAQSIGNGTLLVYDATASTGITTLNIQEGAGQGATSTLSILANNGTTTRFTVLGTSGNVGIGTGTPLATLHVQGSGANNIFTISSSTGAHILTVFPSGNVGIGAVGTGNGAAPNSKLYVTYADGSANSVTNGLTLNNVAGQPGNFVGMRLGLYSGNDTSQKQFIGAVQATNGSGGTGDIVFLTITNGGSAYQQVAAADEKMRITNYGNVGIGTTAPAALLHVETSSSTWPLLKIATSTNQGIFNINSNGNVGIGTTSPAGNFVVQPSANSVSTARFLNSAGTGIFTVDTTNNQVVVNGDSGYGLKLLSGDIKQAASSLTIETINTYPVIFSIGGYGEAMRVNTGGNVGIGTTSPIAKLDVYGNLNVATSSTPALFVNTATGNVGIGTTSPARTLHVTGNMYLQIGSTPVFTDANSQGLLITTNGSANGNNPFRIVTNFPNSQNNAFIVTNAGNTGVGTTAPLSRLDVAGLPGNNDIANFSSSTGATVMRITSTGNVGIGTTTPTLGPLTMASGAYVTVGGTWTNASDRNLKENFASVTPASILEKIVNLPIAKWNYKREDASITHLGPTAQDFYAAFGLGGSDTSISTIDPSGVALVGIKALDEKINSLQQTVSNLQNTGSDVNPESAIVFKTHVYLSQDSVGQAKILAGTKRVKVTFAKPYEYQPIVTATPLDFVSGAYRIASTTAEGFTIELKYAQDEDVTFNFHAFASPEAKLMVSDGSSENIVLVVPQVAGASVEAGETVKENVNTPPSQLNEAKPPESPAPIIDEPQTASETNTPETPPPTVEPAVEAIPAVEESAPPEPAANTPGPEPVPAESPLTTESNN